MLLKLSLTAPAPNNDKDRKELTEIATRLDGTYGKGKYRKPAAAALPLRANQNASASTISAASWPPARIQTNC